MTPINNGGTADARSTSMPGMLALSIGGGLLFASWMFSESFAFWSGFGRLVFFAAAGGLLFWGVKQVFIGDRSAAGRQRRLGLIRHRVMLPRQGMMYLLIMAVMFVGSLLGRSNMLMLVFALMAGPFVLNGWITFSMLKRTRVSRRTPHRIMAGEPVSVEVVLENRKWLLSSWLMTVSDRIFNANEQLDAEVLFTRVPPRGQRHGEYQMRLMQRGRYGLGPIHVTTRFPLGLVERGLRFDARDEILVYPRLGRLSAAWKREHFLAAELVHRQQLRRGAFDDEFHSIREYRWGDNPRAIHWRTSARQNDLMVREFQQSRDRNLVVLLDLWLPRSPLEDDRERVELAVSFAATVCVEQMRQSRDSNLYLAAGGDQLTDWEGRSGPAGIESLLETLAIVEAGQAPDVGQLIESSTARRTPTTRALLITTRQPVAGRIDGLEGMVSGRTANETGSEMQVYTASQDELSPLFRL